MNAFTYTAIRFHDFMRCLKRLVFKKSTKRGDLKMKLIEDWKVALGKLLQKLKECNSEDELKKIESKMKSYATQLKRLNKDVSLEIEPTLIRFS